MITHIIFLLAFNPILQFIQENARFAYKIQENSHITLPYADDFCIITTDKRTQQRIMTQVAEKINSMGMKIKPSKCRSFSLSSVRPSVVPFDFEGYNVPSIADEEQKFLGRVLFYSGKAQDCFTLLNDVSKTKLDNLDKTLIGTKFKLEI